MASICDEALESGDITSDEHESLSNYLRFIHEDVESGCCTDAVMNTNSFWGCLHGLQIPSIEKEAISLSAKHAAIERARKRWTDKHKKELRREYEQGKDKFEHVTTHYKHLARRFLHDEKKWRQIKKIIENPMI
jgi:hypothetical protein